MNWKEIIKFDSDKRSGKPCVRDTRMTVEDIESYFAGGMTFDEFINDFPYINKEDILACFAYMLMEASKPINENFFDVVKNLIENVEVDLESPLVEE